MRSLLTPVIGSLGIKTSQPLLSLGPVESAVVALPVRKEKTPFIGQRVLDGTSSAYDWEPNTLGSIKELARSVNPKKGYIVTANNRQTSDFVKFDHGAGNVSTARSRRISEIIESGIAEGKKFTADDMNEI